MSRRKSTDEKQYNYTTDRQWGIMTAIATGKIHKIPLWGINMTTLGPLLDPDKRGWIKVDADGELVFTPKGAKAYERHRYAEIPLRSENTKAYRSKELSATVQSLMSRRALHAIEREAERETEEAYA